MLAASVRNVLCILATLTVLLVALQAVYLADEVAVDGTEDEDGKAEKKVEGAERLDDDNMKRNDVNGAVSSEFQRESQSQALKLNEEEDAQREDGEKGAPVEIAKSLVESYEQAVTVVGSGETENVSGNVSDQQTGSGVELLVKVEPERPPQKPIPPVNPPAEPEEGEIASLEEFKRKKMQEEEQNKRILDATQLKPTNGNGKKTKKKSNNYASVDCGAEVIDANSESTRLGAILQENKDDYMLNPCSADIWFVVKLCDIILVDTIEIANYELFSSTPESFRVYVSDRNPTTEWNGLGTFQARAERGVQSFPLDEHVYARFIKVEMVSHFGSEHYCPISLFRVLGSTMVEEYQDHEDQNEVEQSVEDLVPIIETATEHDSPNEGFFSSVANAVLGLVSAVVAAGMDNNSTEERNKTDLQKPEAVARVNNTINETSVGINETAKMEEQVETAPQKERKEQSESFSQQEITLTESSNATDAAKVNVTEDERIAIKEPAGEEAEAVKQTNVLRGDESSPGSHVHKNGEVQDHHEEELELAVREERLLSSAAAASGGNHSSIEDVSPEKRNKTALAVANLIESDSGVKEDSPTCDTPVAEKHAEIETTRTDPGSSETADGNTAVSNNSSSTQTVNKRNGTSTGLPLNTTSNHTVPTGVLNDTDTVVRTVISSDTPTTIDVNSVANGTAASPILNQQANQKESVFIRLGNKIKNLEANLTLISHYLEELGLNLKKFKKNSTDMQKTFEKRLSQLNDTVMQQQKQLSIQTELLEDMHHHVTLLTDLVKDLGIELRDFRPQMYYTHGVLIVAELILVVVFIFTLLWFIQRKVHVVVQKLQTTVLNQPMGHANGPIRRLVSRVSSDGSDRNSRSPSPVEPKDSGFVEMAGSQGLSSNSETLPVLNESEDMDYSSKPGIQRVRGGHSDLSQSRLNFQQLLSPSTMKLLRSITENDYTRTSRSKRQVSVASADTCLSDQTRRAGSKPKISS